MGMCMSQHIVLKTRVDDHNDDPLLEEQLICQPNKLVSDDEDSTGVNDDALEDKGNWPDELKKAPP